MMKSHPRLLYLSVFCPFPLRQFFVQWLFLQLRNQRYQYVALRVASTMDRGKIVVILADGGWKYLSEDLWTRDLDQLEDDLE